LEAWASSAAYFLRYTHDLQAAAAAAAVWLIKVGQLGTCMNVTSCAAAHRVVSPCDVSVVVVVYSGQCLLASGSA